MDQEKLSKIIEKLYKTSIEETFNRMFKDVDSVDKSYYEKVLLYKTTVDFYKVVTGEVLEKFFKWMNDEKHYL